MSIRDTLNIIQRWLQKEDDELLYEPDDMPAEDGVCMADPGYAEQHNALLGMSRSGRRIPATPWGHARPSMEFHA